MSHFVYVVMGESESGDDYGPYVFDGPPSVEQLRKICESDAGDWNGKDFAWDGSGLFGSYIYLGVEKVAVEKGLG